MKKSVILGVTAALLMVPNIAWAGCAHKHGSFDVACESGVKVYRHNAPDLRGVGLSPSSTQLKIAKMRQKTEMARISASRAAAQDMAALRARQLDNERLYYRRATRQNSRYGYGGGYRLGGYGLGSGLVLGGGPRRRGPVGTGRVNRPTGGVIGREGRGTGRRAAAAQSGRSVVMVPVGGRVVSRRPGKAKSHH